MISTESLILVDSNILIYSLDDVSPKYGVAKRFLEEKSFNLILSQQALLETFRVITHKVYPNTYTPLKALTSLVSIYSQRAIVHPRENTFNLTQKLIKKHGISSDKVFDAYMVATAVDWGIGIVATDNEKDFRKFGEIKVFNPFK